MNYEDWIVRAEKINLKVDDAENFLNKTISELLEEKNIKIGSMGLLPDEVRESEKFKIANKRFKIAFEELRNFNKNSSKAFMRKRSELKRKKQIRPKDD